MDKIKIDKQKVSKIMKSKKAMKMLLVSSILLAIIFYGIAITMSNFGIVLGTDILKQWGYVFIMIAIGIYAYISFVFDEELKKNIESKTKKKTNGEKTVKKGE